jgi:nitrogenase molybdenum-iron protein beta chain
MSCLIEQPRYTCALGAQQTVVAIRRACPIVHAGPGCSGKISGLIGQGEGYAGGNTIPCTNSTEREIVYGGEDKLRTVIEGAFQVIDADLFVVLTGCTSDIVGDDVASVTGEFQQKGQPIVHCETGGFKSNNYVSHEQVVNAIIDQYVDRFSENREIRPNLVNVFATLPYQDPYWEGNLEELKRILTGIGLKVNILFGQRSKGVSEWLTIPNAALNIVVSAWSGLGIARHLEEKYGTPHLHFPYLPIGGIETSRFLGQVGEALNLSKDQVEGFVGQEEHRYYAHLERMADFMLEFRYGQPRRFYTLLDATYGVGVSKFLVNEMGILPARQFVVDGAPEEFQSAIREQFEHISKTRSARVDFESDAGAIQQAIRGEDNRQRSLLLGSSWERDLAKDIKADLLILSPPVAHRLVLSRGYLGYDGGLRLIEDIYDRVLDTYR